MKRSKPLVLSVFLLLSALPCPAQLLYGTYLGGNNDDDCWVVSPAQDGGVYVAGMTYALSGFPTTPGVYDETGLYPGDRLFVSHFGPNGEFIASTLFGEIQTPEDPRTSDGVTDMILVYDSVRSALWISGATREGGWPVTPDAIDTVWDGPSDAILIRFSADLTTLEYCTYLGGNSEDAIKALVVGDDGRIYAAGETYSTDFPTTPDALFTDQEEYDCFLWVYDPDAQNVVFSTYLGGSNGDALLYALAIDPNGIAWFIARTTSSDLPVTENAIQSEISETLDGDILLAGISFDPPTLEYCTYLGGEIVDEATSLAVEDSLIWLAGRTASPDFPVSPDAYDTTGPEGALPNWMEAFVSKLNWRTGDYRATFFGGGGTDVTAKNKNWVHDSTLTLLCVTDGSFDLPVTPDAYQSEYDDGVVVKFDRTLTNLLYCSYFGAIGQYDEFNAAYVENPDSLWLIGQTFANNFPTTPNAIQPTGNAMHSGFVAHFALDTTADTTSATPSPFISDDFSFSVYPNPFNPTTVLAFNLPNMSDVELHVYDVLGREILSENFGRLTAGQHEYRVDGSAWASGIYFVTLKTVHQQHTTKLLLLR